MSEEDYEEQLLSFILARHPEDGQYNHAANTLGILKPVMMHKINEGIKSCHDCRNCCNPSIHSLVRGNPKAPVMVVAEGILPAQLALNKETVYPLEGTRELELVEEQFLGAGLSPEDLFWMNRVNCYCEKEIDGRTFQGVPDSSMVSSCRDWLKYAVKYLDPAVVVLLGTGPLTSFFPGEKMINAHGNIRNLDFYDIITCPLYSPSLVIEQYDRGNEQFLEEFTADVEKMVRYIKKQFEEK